MGKLYQYVGYEDCSPDVCLWYYDFLRVARMPFRNLIFEPTQYYPLIAM